MSRDFLRINLNELSEYLLNRNQFVYEAELIKVFFPNVKFCECSNIELYYTHFILFHHLYKLKPYFKAKGKKLHIHFMRIGLVDFPKENECSFFDEVNISFCKNKTIDKYCKEHFQYFVSDLPETIDSNELFYLDIRNFNFFNEETLDNWYSGINIALKDYKYFKQALKLLNLNDNYNQFDLKNNYRTLAKKYHPDLNSEHSKNYQRFLDINRAYQYLLKCTPSNL